MPVNIFSKVGNTELSVFRNPDAFAPDYVPQELPGREHEAEEIATALKPAAEGGRPTNLFIHGPAGTGKTCTCRNVTTQLKEYSGKPLVVYVNCWQNNTRLAILSALAQAAGEVVPRRGVASDEVFIRALQQLKLQRRTPVIILDEADKLFYGGEQEVLYDLTRGHETYGVPIGVVLVTNNGSLIAQAEQRIRSSLAAREIEFKAYSPPQLKMILSKRAVQAFVPGSWDDETIALCAAFGAKNNGDCRISIQALYQAARNADRRGAGKISLDDCRNALAKIIPSAEQKKERDVQLLPDGLQNALEILRASGKPMPMTDFYKTLEEKHGVSERTARDYLRELEFNKLATVTEERGEMGERRRTISLK